MFIQSITQQENYNLFFANDNQTRTITHHTQTNQAFICSFMTYNSNSSFEIQLLIIHKPKLTMLQSLRFLYNDLINQIRDKESIIYAIQIANGIIIQPTTLNDMISRSKRKSAAIVPIIETIPIGIFAKIEHFANYQYNIYNLNYYSIAGCMPFNHRLCLLRINNQLYDLIKIYFDTKINIDGDADIYYHDYLFSLYLIERDIDIIKAKEIKCSYKRTQISFEDMMREQTNKMSGIYASIFDIGKFWVNCKIFSMYCCNKVIMMFLFIGLFVDLCFPSIMSIVIYAIFNEAFNSNNVRLALFLTGLYLLLIFITASFSLIITNKSNLNNDNPNKAFFVIYILFSVFYLFVLICSVPAIHFVNINKTNDEYTFNQIALWMLIVCNFVFGIIPFLMNAKSFFKSFLNALIYLVFGAAGCTSVFLNYSIINSSDMIGTSNAKINGIEKKDKSKPLYRKAVVIIIYTFTNAF